MSFYKNSIFVGEDEFGNKYYTKKEKRFIIYNGKAESSKISPYWHLWLHYASSAPEKMLENSWKQPRVANFTGTPLSYRPSPYFKPSLYEPWKP